MAISKINAPDTPAVTKSGLIPNQSYQYCIVANVPRLASSGRVTHLDPLGKPGYDVNITLVMDGRGNAFTADLSIIGDVRGYATMATIEWGYD